MTIQEMLAEADRHDDGRMMRRAIEHMRSIGLNTYSKQRDFVSLCGISAERYEELCQLADEVQ